MEREQEKEKEGEEHNHFFFRNCESRTVDMQANLNIIKIAFFFSVSTTAMRI